MEGGAPHSHSLPASTDPQTPTRGYGVVGGSSYGVEVSPSESFAGMDSVDLTHTPLHHRGADPVQQLRERPSYEAAAAGVQSRAGRGAEEGHSHSHSESSGHGHSHGGHGHGDDHGHGGHGHSHGEDHSHSHTYTPAGFGLPVSEARFKTYSTWQLFSMILEDNDGKQLGGYLLLRIIYTVAALFLSSLSDSVGLVCLAFHSLFECIGLGMELWATAAGKYQPSTVTTYSYGYSRMEVLVGFGNAVFTIFVSIFTIEHAVEALLEPPVIQSGPVMTIAVAGFILNLIGLVIAQNTTTKETKKKLVGEVLWIRLVADNLSCIGVMISAYLVSLGYYAADPVSAFLISVAVIYSSVPLAKETASILLLATPHQVKDQLYACVGKINALDGVLGCSDERFWSSSSGRVVASLKVRLRNDAKESDVLHSAYQIFGSLVSELTVQVEKDDWSVHSGQQILEA